MKNSLKTLFIRIDGYGFFNLVFGTVRWFVVLLMRRIYSEKKLKRRIYDFEMGYRILTVLAVSYTHLTLPTSDLV